MSRLIDADALIGELHNTYLYNSDDRSVIYRKIEEQPTVDAVPSKHGHWIDDEKSLCNGIIERHCSLCGQMLSSAKTRTFSYCPNCGALMDEVMRFGM